MTQAAERRRTGRPPRGVDRRQWNPCVAPALFSALQRKAGESGVAVATYCELVVSLAHGYHSDRIEKLDIQLAMVPSDDELQRHITTLSPGDVLRGLTGGSPRPITVDEPLALEIVQRKDALGVTISDYIRTIYSEAVGRAADIHQDELDFTVPSRSHRRERLAS